LALLVGVVSLIYRVTYTNILLGVITTLIVGWFIQNMLT
jgi:multisubunit Na+/H+ antiporter MnhE subunit